MDAETKEETLKASAGSIAIADAIYAGLALVADALRGEPQESDEESNVYLDGKRK